MNLEKFQSLTLPKIEEELKDVLEQYVSDDLPLLQLMVAYHMGWENLGEQQSGSGKRIRPLLVLLSNHAGGGDWEKAIPASAAVEYIHNFSLVHDDIQDQSHLRRGRTTLWVRWGIAQAINAGDLMFTLGHLSMVNLKHNLNADVVLSCAEALQKSCVKLTHGQYLDLSYEDRNDLQLDDYWKMIGGKTAALISCCAELGSIVAGSDNKTRENFRNYGYSLGLAFQILDDWLGIWGDSALIGKATDSDLVSGKKSLPILYGLNQNGKFADRWAEGPILADESLELADLLAEEGAKEFTEEMAKKETDRALDYLSSAVLDSDHGAPLIEITNWLLTRKK